MFDVSDSEPPPWATVSEFMRDRWDFLSVAAAKNSHGTWDVVLRIDGSYSQEDVCRAAADLFRRELAAALATEGIPVQREIWEHDHFRS